MNINICKSMVIAVAFGAILSFSMQSGFAGETGKKTKKLKPQETCPIMGAKIDKSLFVDAKGKRIYVCCEYCVKAVKKDPAAALKKLAELGEKAEDIPIAQKTCPVMGGAINKDLYVEHKGKKLYVCCKACLAVVKKDPEKYAKKIAEQIEKDKKKEEKAAKDKE